MSEFFLRRFAVISDIHGNSDALRAVLSDIEGQELAEIVNLGDHFSGPLAADEVADILIERKVLSIRGNHDRWLIEKAPGEMGPSDAAAHALLSDKHLAWLRSLEPTRILGDVFLCHGTPDSDTAYWLETVGADGSVSLTSRFEIEQRAIGLSSSLILCGHTHIPRRVDLQNGRTILNPGSVGCPAYVNDQPVPHNMQTGTSTACYAIVERHGNAWVSSIRQVPYDPRRMVEMARGAQRAEWANALAAGWIG